MPDWLIKLFGGMSTKKSAAIAFFTILAGVVSWKYLVVYLAEQGLKEELIPYFILIFWFGFSLMFVEALIFFYDFCREKIKAIKAREASRLHALERSAKVRDVLKVLPTQQIEVLETLLGGDLVLPSLSAHVYTLSDAKFIVSMHKTGPSEHVFRIDPMVRKELEKLVEERWGLGLERFIGQISSAHQSALELFFCDGMPYGTAESSELMPRDVYNALCNLVERGYLQSIPPKKRRRMGSDETIEEFVIDEKFRKALVGRGLFSGSAHSRIGVDWRFVIGSSASGGGG